MMNFKEYILKEEEKEKESRETIYKAEKYVNFLNNIENSAEYIKAKTLLSQEGLFFESSGEIVITGHASLKEHRLRGGDDVKLKRIIESLYPKAGIGRTNFSEQLERNMKVIDLISAVYELIKCVSVKKIKENKDILSKIEKALKSILPAKSYEKLSENSEAIKRKSDPNSAREFTMIGAFKKYFSNNGEALIKKELYGSDDKSSLKYISDFKGLKRYDTGDSGKDDDGEKFDDEEEEDEEKEKEAESSGPEEKDDVKTDKEESVPDKEVNLNKKSLSVPEELKNKSYYGVSFDEAEEEFLNIKKLSDTNMLLSQFKNSSENSIFNFSLEDIDKKIDELKIDYTEKDWKADKSKIKTARYGGSKSIGRIYTKLRDTESLKKDLEEDIKGWRIDRQTKNIGKDPIKISKTNISEIFSNLDSIREAKRQDTLKKAQNLIGLYSSKIKSNLEKANKKIQKYRNTSKVIKNFNKGEYINDLGLSLNLAKNELSSLVKRLHELLYDYKETILTALDEISIEKSKIKEKLSNEKDYGARKNIATENLATKIEKEAEKEAEKERFETAKKSAEALKKDRTDENRQTEGLREILAKKEAKKAEEEQAKKEEREESLRNYANEYNAETYGKKAEEYFSKDPETGLPLNIDTINKQNDAVSSKTKKNLTKIEKSTQEIAKALMGIQKIINKKTPKKAQNVVIGNGLNKNQVYSKDYNATSTANQKMASLYFKEEYLIENEEVKNLTIQIFTPYRNANDRIIIALNKAVSSSDSKSIIDSLKEVSSIINSSDRPKLTIPTYAKEMLNSIISISDKLENLGDNKQIEANDYLSCVKILKSLNNFVEMAIIGFKEEVLKRSKVSDSIPENSKPALTTKKISKDKNLDLDNENPDDEESEEDLEDKPKNLLDLAKKNLKASK